MSSSSSGGTSNELKGSPYAGSDEERGDASEVLLGGLENLLDVEKREGAGDPRSIPEVPELTERKDAAPSSEGDRLGFSFRNGRVWRGRGDGGGIEGFR